MSKKTEIQLAIPALFEPLELWEKDFKFKVTSPHLSSLLTSLEFIDVQKVHGPIACFFNRLGWGSDEIPAAHYRVFTHQSNTSHSNLDSIKALGEENGILCADPVHLEVGMNDVTLTDLILDLSESEAKEILALLNRHFQQDGLEFIYGNHQHWYVTFPMDETLKTTPLENAFKKNIIGMLPSSNDRNWQQIQNEIQMLLHDSEVNKQREIADLPTLNSLWFWGGGGARKTSSNFSTVFSRGDTTTTKIQGKMFAQAATCKWQELPDGGKSLLTYHSTETGNSFVLLDQLQQAASEENLDAYQHTLTQIDKEYIQPLAHSWKNNRIKLVIEADGCLLRPLKIPTWKFWEKPTQLVDIASKINQQKTLLNQNKGSY